MTIRVFVLKLQRTRSVVRCGWRKPEENTSEETLGSKETRGDHMRGRRANQKEEAAPVAADVTERNRIQISDLHDCISPAPCIIIIDAHKGWYVTTYISYV